jgi:GDP-4-dehydro-6-deoxy-D-mannose reductase
LCVDITDPVAFNKTIVDVAPSKIFHLAGSFENEWPRDWAMNFESTRTLLDSALTLRERPRILLIGSAAEYGPVPSELNPIRETQPVAPRSVYALTKSMQSLLFSFYSNTFGLDIVLARVFNLLGTGLSTKLFVGHLESQIAEYKTGIRPYVEVGNTSAIRDYIRVEDAALALILLMDEAQAGGIYNVGTGKGIRIQDLLMRILYDNHISPKKVVHSGQSKPDGADPNVAIADISKLTRLGFQLG